jgi:hypothetical protein
MLCPVFLYLSPPLFLSFSVLVCALVSLRLPVPLKQAGSWVLLRPFYFFFIPDSRILFPNTLPSSTS